MSNKLEQAKIQSIKIIESVASKLLDKYMDEIKSRFFNLDDDYGDLLMKYMHEIYEHALNKAASMYGNTISERIDFLKFRANEHLNVDEQNVGSAYMFILNALTGKKATDEIRKESVAITTSFVVFFDAIVKKCNMDACIISDYEAQHQKRHAYLKYYARGYYNAKYMLEDAVTESELEELLYSQRIDEDKYNELLAALHALEFSVTSSKEMFDMTMNDSDEKYDDNFEVPHLQDEMPDIQIPPILGHYSEMAHKSELSGGIYQPNNSRFTKPLVIIGILAAIIVAFIFWNQSSSTNDTSTNEESTVPETAEPAESSTEKTEPVYAKIGDLTIDITYLNYDRVKSPKDFNLSGFTEKEKKNIWKRSTELPNSKAKVWEYGKGYYILTLIKCDESISSTFDSLDEFIDDFKPEEDTETSGEHIDIDGVHAYKLLEKKHDDEQWGMSETTLLHDKSFYIITVRALYEGSGIDLPGETNRIISHANLK